MMIRVQQLRNHLTKPQRYKLIPPQVTCLVSLNLSSLGPQQNLNADIGNIWFFMWKILNNNYIYY